LKQSEKHSRARRFPATGTTREDRKGILDDAFDAGTLFVAEIELVMRAVFLNPSGNPAGVDVDGRLDKPANSCRNVGFIEIKGIRIVAINRSVVLGEYTLFDFDCGDQLSQDIPNQSVVVDRQQFPRVLDNLSSGEKAVPFVSAGLKDMPDRCANSRRSFGGYSYCQRNPVGGKEADSVNVTRQTVWILRDDSDGLIAIGFVRLASSAGLELWLFAADRPAPLPSRSQPITEARPPTSSGSPTPLLI
jgi:hypothetical protein